MSNVSTFEEIKLAIKKSDEKMRSVDILYQKGLYADAVSRLYYAFFHIIGACLKVKKIDLSQHKHVYIMNQFQKHFIHTHIFENEFYVLLVALKQSREWGDYNLFENIEKDKMDYFMENVPKVIIKIKAYLKNEIGQSL